MAFENIQYLPAMLRSFTWKRVAMFGAFVLICLAAYGIYENRNHIYASLNISRTQELARSVKITVSRENREYIEDRVKRSDLIIAAQVIEIDFPKNARRSSFMFTDSDELQAYYQEYLKDKITDDPLLTNLESENVRLARLINGEFFCLPIEQTVAGRMLPAVHRYVTTICSVSVPPVYGQFSGYVNIYLKRIPSETDLAQIRSMMYDVSARIYATDMK